ncbi:MAG: hypothetical protein U1E72_03620 [Burkholderiaceae bacterium]
MRAQENAILAKFRELGVDSNEAAEVAETRKVVSASSKGARRAGAAYTPDVMQKAMTRLFKDGSAAYGDTSAD